MRYLYTSLQIKDLIFFFKNIKHFGHGYDVFYEEIFKKNRTKNLNIMEFGVHHGGLSCSII